MPAGSTGTADVMVTTSTSNQTKFGGYTYLAPPVVTSGSPTSGPASGGTTITGSGSGLANATVTMGGLNATLTDNTDTSITIIAPAHAAGVVDVIITTPGGSFTASQSFTYIAPPSVTSVSPTSGLSAGGTSVTITGTVFQNGATVTFGGTAATAVRFVSATRLIATTPAHAAGAVTVVVTNPDGQSGTLTSGFGYSGTLSITAAPASFSYPATVLKGDVVTLTSSFAVSVNDATLSNAGWNLQAQIGTLTNAANDTIAASNQTITAALASGTTGTPPTNSIGYPVQIPTKNGKIYNAAINTGNGQATVTFSTKLAVPASTSAGTYSTTLIITIVSGP
jgi:hypothetical protein